MRLFGLSLLALGSMAAGPVGADTLFLLNGKTLKIEDSDL